MVDIAAFMQRQPHALSGVADAYMRGAQFRDQRENAATLRELNALKLQDVRDKMAQAQSLRDILSQSVNTRTETTPFVTDEEQAFGLPALSGNIASQRDVSSIDLAGLKDRAAKAGLYDVMFDLEKREQDAAVKQRDYDLQRAELESLDTYRKGQLANDKESNRLRAIRDKGGAAEIKAADTNALYKQAAGLFGGTFDDQGNLIALDPKVRGKVADLAARSEAYFMKDRKVGYAGAVKKAAQEMGIMEGAAPTPTPGASGAQPAGVPARPQNLDDASLLRQADEAIAAGADPKAIQARLDAWGVKREKSTPQPAPKQPAPKQTPQERLAEVEAKLNAPRVSLMKGGIPQQMKEGRIWLSVGERRMLEAEAEKLRKQLR